MMLKAQQLQAVSAGVRPAMMAPVTSHRVQRRCSGVQQGLASPRPCLQVGHN